MGNVGDLVTPAIIAGVDACGSQLGEPLVRPADGDHRPAASQFARQNLFGTSDLPKQRAQQCQSIPCTVLIELEMNADKESAAAIRA